MRNLIFFCILVFVNCKKPSSDSKVLWQKVELNYTGHLTDIKFINNQTGFILSFLDLVSTPNQTVIFKTRDAGLNWTKIAFNKLEDGGFGSFFPISENFIFSGGDKFYSSVDGGKKWSVLDSLLYGYGELHFFDDINGVACGLQKIYKTGDGGLHFSVVFDSNIGQATIRKLQFPSLKVGYAIAGGTNAGYLLKTIDSGNSWSIFRTEINEITDVFFINEIQGWIFTAKNEILMTLDGGVNWQIIPHNETIVYPKSFFLDAFNGYISQGNKIFSTVDGGKTWVKEFESSGYNFTNLIFIGGKIGLAIDAEGKVLRK